MRFVRIVSAALVAFALLYLIHQKRLKNAPPADTPQAETVPETESESGSDQVQHEG